MDWVPVSKERFEGILAEELEALRPEVMRLYEQYAVSPFQLPCLRGENSVTEYVFVLAKKEERLLYYDDVEEDFGVAIPDEDGVLRNWGNYGPLVQRLSRLPTTPQLALLHRRKPKPFAWPHATPPLERNSISDGVASTY